MAKNIWRILFVKVQLKTFLLKLVVKSHLIALWATPEQLSISLNKLPSNQKQKSNEKKEKEYYSLGCLVYFLKNKHIHHPKYVQQAARDNISAVYRPDRRTLLDYLHGKETQAGIYKFQETMPKPNFKIIQNGDTLPWQLL